MVRRPSVHNFKHLFLCNRLAKQSQIYVELPWEGRTKVYKNGPGHMTKMAAMPIYGKNLLNILQDHKSNDLETWHAASGTQALQSLYK